ncbi:MAG: ATP-dependent DNA helicase RecG [Candidatus Limnocylindrales bacterium]
MVGSPAGSGARRTAGSAARGSPAAEAPGVARSPLAPAALLRAPIAESGLAAQRVLRRTLPRLGVATVRDLLFHLPRRYDDLRRMRRISELRSLDDGEMVSVRATVSDLRVQPTFRRRVQRTIARLVDETGEAEVVWFGRRYIERRLAPGAPVIVSGRVNQRGFAPLIDNPDFEVDDGSAILSAGRIVPVYRLTTGLNAARLRSAIRDALDRAGPGFEEYLPSGIRATERLVGIAEAVEAAHFPESFETRDRALRRLAFDELLALQIGMVGRRRQRGRSRGAAIEASDETDGRVRIALRAALERRVGRPLEFTADQTAAMDALRADLGRTEPMLRLLQGDVGSGKTAVAAHALALSALDHRQGALLAPTDLLARQHAETIGDLVSDLGVRVVLLTASLAADARRTALAAIASGEAQIVIGTHALLSEGVTFARLGLAIIDEQHRFGVEQRGRLEAKAGAEAPHVLLMTATPIPRTVGQVLYADLDVSDLRTPPAGRVPVRTGIRRPDGVAGTWARVRDEAANGHRTFVVVPLIAADAGDLASGEAEEDVSSAAVAAESEADRLTTLLVPLRVGLVHGRMRAPDRDAVMTRFRDGDLDVLVGTTVVEVGVDVPAATMMIIEGADRFGLAQLHQLRGRVGRGTAESFCVLVSDTTDAVARARLEALAETRDGFALAEKDFALRREGNVLGFAQSGFPRLRVASLEREEHRELAIAARAHAERLLDADGALRGPETAALAREIESGWLARLSTAEPASGT